MHWRPLAENCELVPHSPLESAIPRPKQMHEEDQPRAKQTNHRQAPEVLTFHDHHHRLFIGAVLLNNNISLNTK
jgi:hypothetical protein